MIYLALAAYAAALILANLLVAKFGPSVTPVLSFVFIGLDLTLRDWLHVRMKAWQLALLICGTGVLTYLLSPAADKIAIASSVSFLAAAMVDWASFVRLPGSWMKRASGSNVAGAAVDSLLFPTLAFGALMPHIVLAQLPGTPGGP